MKEQLNSAAGFIVFLLMCLGTQLTGSFLTLPAIRSGWYAGLQKPAFTPPDWIFGPIWTALYFSLAVAAWMVWRLESEDALVKPALLLFFIHLILNVLWPALFFSKQRPDWAFFEIILLWVLGMFTAIVFFRINRRAGLLLIPYLGWVFYAAVLNGAIWWLNRGLAVPGGGVVA